MGKSLGKLHTGYCRSQGLDSATKEGMAILNRTAGLSGVTFYWARHNFGNLARNKCRMGKDDVVLALNHVDHGNRITDIYIEKDWSIVDEVQANVVGLLFLREKLNAKVLVSPVEQRKTMCLVREL